MAMQSKEVEESKATRLDGKDEMQIDRKSIFSPMIDSVQRRAEFDDEAIGSQEDDAQIMAN